MDSPPVSLYAQWRLHRAPPATFKEDAAPPPERLLQAVWQHQRLRRDVLATLDGQRVRVLHPGFSQPGGGPDFRGAVIQFDRSPPQAGDVEVDLRGSGWRAHGHDRNPAFRNVILHVIWEVERSSQQPTLALRPVLDSPLSELRQWLEHEPAPALPNNLLGKCLAPLAQLQPEHVTSLLRDAAWLRLEAKAGEFEARARQSGWEQALWEGIFRALGFQHNSWPMQALAELLPKWSSPPADVLSLQARALGLGGLLPTESGRPGTAGDKHLRRLWDAWWRERDEYFDWVLPRTVWRLHGLRPANHPHRRLALAAHWLATGDLPVRLERWCASTVSDGELLPSLEKVLAAQDVFWNWHLTLRSPRLGRPQALLGSARATDLAVNVVLPWLFARARHGSHPGLMQALQRRYFAWPAGEDNAVLRLTRQRLFGGRRLAGLTAAGQQGLLQVVRDFCDHTNAICEDCRFPRLVEEYAKRRDTR